MPLARFWISLLLLMIIVLPLAGCGSLLPVAKMRSESPWPDFKANMEVYDLIIPYQSTLEDLRELQIDPLKTPNIKILAYPEILSMFMPNSSFNLLDMDRGIRDCVADSANCMAYQLNLERMNARRYGYFLPDLFNFERKTHLTGWRFSFLLVMVDDVVVYKIWGGTPKIDEHKYQRNPLGPLQEPADFARDTALVSTF